MSPKSIPMAQKPLPMALLIASATLVADISYAQVEEVMVTAQRRSESAQDVPVSLTAYSAGDLKAVNITRSSDLAAQTPNLVAVDGNFGLSAPIISMRGVSNADFSAISNTPIAVYSDGVILNNIQTHGFATFDLERIEILRGPQGTLFGRNSTTGAMQVFSAGPTDEFTAGGELTLGRYARQRAEAYVSGPLTDKTKARLALMSNRSDGHVKNQLGRDAQNEDVQAARLTLSTNISDNFTADWRVAYQKVDNLPVVFHNTEAVNTLEALAGGSLGFSPGGTASDFKRITQSPDYRRQEKGETIMTSMTLNWDLGDVNLTSITSLLDHDFQYQNDEDASSNAFGHSQFFTGQRQYTQEFRVQGNTDKLDWVAGAFFMNEEVEAQGAYDINGVLQVFPHGTPAGFDAANGLGGLWVGAAAAAGFAADQALNVAQAYNVLQAIGRIPAGNVSTRINKHKQDLDSYALFTHLKYQINEQWGATLGLRYSEDKKDLSLAYKGCFVSSDPNGGVGRFDQAVGIGIDPSQAFDIAALVMDPQICGVSNGATVNAGRDAKWDSVSGKLSLEYTPNNDSLFYASVSQGFKGGSFNGTYYSRLKEVEPETLISWELGAKQAFMDNRLLLNASLFRYDYEDFQAIIAVTLPSQLQGVTKVNELLNVPESNINGAELELAYQPIDNLNITMGASWLDSKIEKGPTVNEGTIPEIKGNSFRYAPEFTFNGVVAYDFVMSDGSIISPQIDFNYSDGYFTDVINNPLGKTDDIWKANVRLSWTNPDNRFYTTIFVQNIGNEVSSTSNTREFLESFGTSFTTVNRPRTAGITFAYNF